MLMIIVSHITYLIPPLQSILQTRFYSKYTEVQSTGNTEGKGTWQPEKEWFRNKSFVINKKLEFLDFKKCDYLL